jgi:hypothetical protein
MMDVPDKPKREEFVSHMVQWLNDAGTRDAPDKPKRVEFVSLMVQRENVVATRGVPRE